MMGLISKAELDGKVDVTITVPTEANVGDTLNVESRWNNYNCRNYS
ncbi:hypothetical protein ACN2C3_00020 [Aliarcobacter butzleri]